MKQYIVDAFTRELFRGNPAAVCLLERPLSEDLMISIARENNLSETAFVLEEEGGYSLRWFTPGGEIDLCGHATLASAFVLLTEVHPKREEVSFQTLSGPLEVKREGSLFFMDFPAYDLKKVPITEEMAKATGAPPKEAFLGRDLLLIYDDEETVKTMAPDLKKVKALEGLLLQVTAPGTKTHCTSRTFAPKLSIDEDPVCGSGHCHIVPYWARRLGRKTLTAFQASPRGGVLYCRLKKDRVTLGGEAVLFSKGELRIP